MFGITLTHKPVTPKPLDTIRCSNALIKDTMSSVSTFTITQLIENELACRDQDPLTEEEKKEILNYAKKIS